MMNLMIEDSAAWTRIAVDLPAAEPAWIEGITVYDPMACHDDTSSRPTERRSDAGSRRSILSWALRRVW